MKATNAIESASRSLPVSFMKYDDSDSSRILRMPPPPPEAFTKNITTAIHRNPVVHKTHRIDVGGTKIVANRPTKSLPIRV